MTSVEITRTMKKEKVTKKN